MHVWHDERSPSECIQAHVFKQAYWQWDGPRIGPSVFNEMGGGIRLVSKSGQGTTCHLCFPEVRLPADSSISVISSANSVADMKRETPSRIVLVEDEPYALEALTELLESQGYEVIPCSSAKEARSAFATEKIQLLISDVILADDSGILLAKQACKNAPDMRIILMSGYVPKSEALQKDWQFIRKPIDFSGLCDMITSALLLAQNNLKSANKSEI